MKFVFIIGSRHSGAGLLSKLFYSSHFFMGNLSDSGEQINEFYIQAIAHSTLELAEKTDKFSWNIDRLFTQNMPDLFYENFEKFLNENLMEDKNRIAVKCPDIIFCLPYFLAFMHKAYFIEIVRDPRDVASHGDFMQSNSPFSIQLFSDLKAPTLHHASVLLYQFRLIQACKEVFPWRNYLCIRHEDFVYEHDKTVTKIEDFLQEPLSRMPVDQTSVFRWINGEYEDELNYPFLTEILMEHDYPLEREIRNSSGHGT